MSSPLFNSHEGSCSSVDMDQNIEEQGGDPTLFEENVDEMSEEELERIDEQPNEEQGGDPTPFERKKRIKKSIVWDNMKIVKLKNGTEKVQCNHCKEYFTKSVSGATSQHKRHLSSCLQKKLSTGSGDQTKVKQQILSFTDGQSDGISSITNFSYDHTKVRELASHMVLVHEYPFSMMDHVVFNKFMKAATPFYKKITRQQVREDCNTTYQIEKKKLKSVLKGVSRISVTTDLWKSGQKLQYMVVTGHFVDADWLLQKRVLDFCNVPPPHTGVIIADALGKCFSDWGIENKVSSITVDNAAYNDVCIRRLKQDFVLRKTLSIGGRIFHVRCCAHILNLLVQDGLKNLDEVIDVVRDGVKYLKNSESRLIQFAKIAKQLQLPSRKLILDCPTRWNSTYLMLASALEFKDVFSRYQDIDPGFSYVPSESEWSKVEEVCKFLGIFHEITNMISGSDYPTSNIFLVELYRVKELLNEKVVDVSDNIKAMASESTFSAGGRVIDDRRASMTVETVQMLLCGNDWIRNVYGIKTRPRDSLDVAESSTYQEVDLPDQD